MINEAKQKESGRRLFLAAAGAALCLPLSARASDKLDAGGLTFRDFATLDNGASFARGDPMIAGGPNQVSSKVVGHRQRQGLRPRPLRADPGRRWRCRSAGRPPRTGSGASATAATSAIASSSGGSTSTSRASRTPSTMPRTKVGSIQARRPGVKAQARKLGDGTYLVVFENVTEGTGRCRAAGRLRSRHCSDRAIRSSACC